MRVFECALAESDQLWKTGKMSFWSPQCDVTHGKFSLDCGSSTRFNEQTPSLCDLVSSCIVLDTKTDRKGCQH